MRITTDTPVGSVCLHSKHGAGVLRLNGTIEQCGPDCLPGWPTRVIVVDFGGDWKYMRAEEEYIEILPALADVARA